VSIAGQILKNQEDGRKNIDFLVITVLEVVELMVMENRGGKLWNILLLTPLRLPLLVVVIRIELAFSFSRPSTASRQPSISTCISI
jgi:hypothetical protein